MADPLDRTMKSGVTMSAKEWLLWKVGHRRTTAILTMRSAVHQIVRHSVQIAGEYPEVPAAVVSPADVEKFWSDPEHKFMLIPIREWMRDADAVAREYLEEGILSDADLRSIVDAELPRARWGGGPAAIVTYAVHRPEIRGILSAAALIRAQDGELPPFMGRMIGWIRDEGWSDHGKTRGRAGTAK